MRRTPVYIIASPRPRVGKTLLARLLVEFLTLAHRRAAGFDINMSTPSLIDFLPHLTETASISDTRGEMALMDRLIVHDGVPKVVDLGYPAYDGFFRMIEEIGFVKEAERRGIEPIVLFMPDRDALSRVALADLRTRFPRCAIVPVNNEHVMLGDWPREWAQERALAMPILPGFLHSYIERMNFSFAGYLRGPNDPSAELHQWIRKIFLGFRELELNLILHKLQGSLR